MLLFLLLRVLVVNWCCLYVLLLLFLFMCLLNVFVGGVDGGCTCGC